MRTSSSERTANARRAAQERWRREGDRVAATMPARQAFMRRFEDAADPQHRLPRPERRRRGRERLAAYMRGLRARRDGGAAPPLSG